MGLFREINIDKTCKNVHTFLMKDFQRLQFMAGVDLTNLSSPTLDQAGGSHTNGGNHNEAMIINGIDVGLEVEAITSAINGMSEPYRTIMIDYYFLHKSFYERVNHSSYGQNSYYKRLRTAQLSFADRFEFWQREKNCSKIEDLHIYLDDEKSQEENAK